MRFKNPIIAALFFVSPVLHAHTGDITNTSLMAGLLHPLTGIDHLLVLMAVGFYAAQQGGKALWIFPTLFMLLIASGLLLNTFAIVIPFNEYLIVSSVIIFGILLSVNHKKLANLLFTGASLFAIAHGYAHAAEIPAGANASWYFSSLLLMSFIICISGCAISLVTSRRTHYLLSLVCIGSGLYYFVGI